MRKNINKSFIVLLSFTLLFLSFSTTQNSVSAAEKSVNAAQKSVNMKNMKLENLNLAKVKNLKEILNSLSQHSKDIISSYWLDKEAGSGVINIYNKKEDKYYNLYVEGDSITYYSKQYYTNKETEDAGFELYSIDSEGSMTHEFTSSIAKDTGEVEHVIGINSTNNAAFKWACIFSSYIACAAAAGTLGFGIAGPFGASVAAFACRYVFQTLVEKYGSKQRACKLFS